MKKYFNIIFSIFIVLSACETNSDKDENDILVLQAYLYQDEPVTGISLSHTISFQSNDTLYKQLRGAEIYITWNGSDYFMATDEDGYYYYPGEDLQIAEGNTYSITVNYNGITLTSSTTVPSKPTGLSFSTTTLYFDESSPMMPGSQEENEIEITWDNPDNDYFYVVIQNIEEDPESIELGFQPPDGGPNFRFLSQPFITDRYIIRTLMSLQQYGRHVVKVLSLIHI